MRIVMMLLIACFLTACNTSNNFAPVTNGWSDTSAASQSYRVQPDDTLYSIAFRFGLDYRKLAELNHIEAPYHIAAGQTLQLLPGATETTTTEPVQTGAAPATTVVTSQPVQQTPTPQGLAVNGTGPVGKWLWPAKGPIVHAYSNSYAGNKGIDISGKMGDPVKAAASGKVVYAGTGLRGYGLLIIVKHNTEFLSAYAHNSKALVKEGDTVTQGQTIALMGNSDASFVMLHFEIRQAGKPVDPLKFLPPR